MNSSSSPRMVLSYKRTSSPRSPPTSGELYTPAHEENVRFIHDTWQCVLKDIKSPQSSDRGPQEYVEKNPNPSLLCEYRAFHISATSTQKNTREAKTTCFYLF
uniref:MAPK regulated corepressor interacting protein 1 n=1 Tax=Paramormyrops kingsleyae TaxID=1676925 RepID=A0A3B3RYX0_9TELE